VECHNFWNDNLVKPKKENKMKKLLLAVAASGLIATPALADPVNDTAETQFDGERAIECEIEGTDSFVDFGDLGRRGQASAQVDNGISVFCNQPSEASFTSKFGYLRLVATNPANDSNSESDFTSAANPGFSAGLDYSAEIVGFGLSSDTSALTASVPETVGPVPALNENGVRIRYDTIAESQPLLGGSYTDTLTVTLTTLGV
tara:strand:+ start:474 stop:1082 length:609 start_codon:yes stop_codon:yes gene_type:complete